MSRWEEQLDNHPIHETLNWLTESVSKEFDDADQDEISEKRRLLKVISKYRTVLKSLDSELLPFNQLDTLNSALRHINVASQVEAYAKSGNVENLRVASDHLTNNLTCLSVLLATNSSAPEVTDISEIENLLDITSNTLISKKDELSDQVSTVQANADELSKKIVSLEQALEQQKTELGTLTSNWQNQFSSAQEARSQEFSKWRDSFTTEKSSEITEVINNFEKELEKNQKSHNSALESLIDDGTQKHQAILDLYELTAGDSVGAGYIQNANNESTQANRWRLISITFIILTVFWLLYAYNHKPFDRLAESVINIEKPESVIKDDISISETKTTKPEIAVDSSYLWYTFLVTISISGVLLWGSAYSAQQSTKHRLNEKRTRWFALEVKAFDPFISSLSQAEQSDLKKQLTERIFGQSMKDEIEKTRVIDEHAFSTIVNGIEKILSKIQK